MTDKQINYLLSCKTFEEFYKYLKKEFPNGIPSEKVPKEIKEKEQSFFKETSWYDIQNPIQFNEKSE